MSKNQNQNRAPSPVAAPAPAEPSHSHTIADPTNSHSLAEPTHSHGIAAAPAVTTLASNPELQAAVAQGLADGTLVPQGSANKQASADAGASQGDEPRAPAATASATPSWALGDVVELTAVHGPLLHLHTGEVFGVAPVAAEIDAFIALQLEAGKLAISGAT